MIARAITEIFALMRGLTVMWEIALITKVSHLRRFVPRSWTRISTKVSHLRCY